jgi:MEMO1 family protein
MYNIIMAAISKVRPSPIAGRWYSGDPETLARQIDTYLEQAQLPRIPGDVIGVIAPHAGHRYSGLTAAYAFKTLQGGRYELVAVISPLHRYHPASFLTTSHAAYGTPLGEVEIDRAAVEQVDALLREQGRLGLQPIAYDEEHSLEIELPFLQRVLPGGFRLLPIMARSQNPQDAQALGHALAVALRGQNAVLVASTDLSHFYPEAVAEQMDGAMLSQIGAFSPEGVFNTERSGQGYACGLAAVAAVLFAARELGADRVEILHHSTSADETGDHSSVVGYGAAAILKTS